MTVEIYNVVKTALLSITGDDGLPLFKTVMLWNNQTDHELNRENDNYAVLYPACFIEFNNINTNNLGKKAEVQYCDYDMVLHMARTLIKNEDTQILTDKLKVYQKIQTLEFGVTEPTTGRFTRINENPNYDNNLLMIYEQTYHSTYKDFSAIPTLGSRTLTPVITQTIVDNIS
ncbi:hypothetical protein UFOVP87_20 [uncultured Caudovirales phage]|uniref:Uncharacterized protein n=1 Tax=uncultured Caudovirales phage TaxID=2100421 RepID=A0A6J5KXT3_9CAUD|nr:hypothetical protein UFOVP87_20 [uncultured Caudovirales phage]